MTTKRALYHLAKPDDKLHPDLLWMPIKKDSAGNKFWAATLEKILEWRESYPRVDVKQEMIKARQWLRDNPERQKTGRGMTKFVGGWLARANDSLPPEEETGLTTGNFW
jgi:hypothetical protein